MCFINNKLELARYGLVHLAGCFSDFILDLSKHLAGVLLLDDCLSGSTQVKGNCLAMLTVIQADSFIFFADF